MERPASSQLNEGQPSRRLGRRRGPAAPAASSALAGHAGLPFAVRYNLTFAKTDAALDYLALVFLVLGCLRFRSYFERYPATYVWYALHLGLALGNTVWRRRCLAAYPGQGGSWARWREIVAAVVRGTGMGAGLVWRLVRAGIDDDDPFTGTNVFLCAFKFFNITGAPMLMLLWSKPLRSGWALPVQLLLTLVDITPYAPFVCSSPGMQAQQLSRLLHPAAQLTDMARLALHPMLPWRITEVMKPGSVEECAAVMVFIQLALGLVLPAVLQARLEARMFQQHQLERWRLGLLPESGLNARVYAAFSQMPQCTRTAFLCLTTILVLWEAVLMMH